MRVPPLVWMVTVALGLSLPASAQTQITTAVLEGVVVDPSDAALPGVTVEVKNADTNLTRTSLTDPEGRFLLAQLPPGRYTATFSLAGFAPRVFENAVLTVGQALRLQVAMSVSASEVVDVSAQAPIVDTTRTAATSTIDETTIATIPILGRKFEDLLTLTPGVSVVQGPDGDEITFSGQRGVFNNISLDGGDYNN